jgi:hypothetical protein
MPTRDSAALLPEPGYGRRSPVAAWPLNKNVFG